MHEIDAFGAIHRRSAAEADDRVATEFRGSATREIHEGESVRSDKDTVHWWRNDGNVPVVFVVADVFNPPK